MFLLALVLHLQVAMVVLQHLFLLLLAVDLVFSLYLI
jgi:hypothetical protein